MNKPLHTIYEDEETVNQDKLDIILKKLGSLEEKVSKIEEKLDKNTENCEKMSSHIDFIERVYSGLKSPLEYVKYTLGFSENRELPSP